MSKVKFLDLGLQPLANGFLTPGGFNIEYKFPLGATFDAETKLVSLSEFVDPPVMFNDHYAYQTSMSEPMVQHFKETADMIKEKFKPKSILEIGSNDGAFIRNFTKEEAVTVEPCGNYATYLSRIGYKCYHKFWDKETAGEIIEKHGEQDVIYAANCMCHIPNIIEAFQCITACLSNDGFFIFEDPSIDGMIKMNAYDQIYDEHAHIFSITALSNLLNLAGLKIISVEPLSQHGGSNRIYAVRNTGSVTPNSSVRIAINKEHYMKLDQLDTFMQFADRVRTSKDVLRKLLTRLKGEGKKIVSYGASSKSTVVFNYCKIDTNFIDYIVDNTVYKQRKFSPGVHIPILPPEAFVDRSIDYAFLGAWNFSTVIREKEMAFVNRGGKFITHVPTVHVI